MPFQGRRDGQGHRRHVQGSRGEGGSCVGPAAGGYLFVKRRTHFNSLYTNRLSENEE